MTTTSPNSSQLRGVSAAAISNSDLIKHLKLLQHPEGGYYAETDRQSDEIPSPFADGRFRPLATTIYYLLTCDEPKGVFHMNKSVTMHVHHQGRAEYTLIYPESPPRVETKIVGPNVDAGETLQLLVGSNIWKKSRLLDEDLAAAEEDPEIRTYTRCLITEVVFPGFHWEDHQYLTREGLEKIWDSQPGWKEWLPFVKQSAP